MIRDFVAGVIWGSVVAGVGLGVISQVSPMRPAQAPVMTPVEGQPAEPAAEAVAAPKSEPAPVEKVEEKVETPDAKAAPAQDKAAETETEKVVEAEMGADSVPPKADTEPVEPVSPADPVEVEAEDVPPDAPKGAPEATATTAPAAVEKAPAAPDTSAVKPAEPPAATDPVTPPASEEASPAIGAAGTAPKAEGAESAPVAEPAPVAPPLTETAPEPAPGEGLLTPTEEPEAPMPSTIAPDPALPSAEAGQDSTLAPAPGLSDAADGVTTGRLPSIGGEAAEAPAPEAIEPDPSSLPPLQRYARSFENSSGKPLFAILLVDPGTADINRADLAALPFPVTFVVDPLAANAGEIARGYRAAGQEVVMLATGIPEGAQAADLEQTFAAYEKALPEAVALIDLTSGGFQDERSLAAQVVPLVKAQGRGLLTFDRGLNAADQVARREDLPAAVVFRTLDDDGEDSPLIRRYLDRAAFKAAQEGKVVVLGTARPETIAALMEWTVEGRASSVTLAPASAVMSVD